MKIRIGTRGSKLALWQAQHIVHLLREHVQNIDAEIKVIKTSGDKFSQKTFAEIGRKGVFVKEIEEALLSNEIDLAVHSLKDMPTTLPEGLVLGAVTKRDSPADALISQGNVKLDDLTDGARIGTASVRRRAQLLAYRPDFQIIALRGNIDTRLRKLRTNGLDAIMVAEVGLKRLGLLHEMTERIPFSIILPAMGQGVIGIEIRKEEHAEILKAINDEATWCEITAERSLLHHLGGGCRTPVGCLARLDSDDQLMLEAALCHPDGRQVIRHKIKGQKQEAEKLGRELCNTILNSGGREILNAL